MMQGGNMGEKDSQRGKTVPQTDKLEISVCDVSSDDFKKTWLALKEIHDKELHRLQAKLTSLRKERLAEGRRAGSTAKIKELTEQQKVLSDTIQELRKQLCLKTCGHCSVNEAYGNTLQQEFYDIQQQNLNFIAELTVEMNKLREENKMLSEKLKLTQQKFSRFSEGEGDLIPCAQRSVSVSSIKEPAEEEESQVYEVPMKLMEQSSTEQMKFGGKKEQQQSSEYTIPFHSQDLFDVAETSFEKMSSNTSKPAAAGSANQKSPTFFPIISTESIQGGHKRQVASNLSGEELGQAKKKETTFTQRTSSQMEFPWSLSSITEEPNPAIQLGTETSEENMPDDSISLSSLTQRRDTRSSIVFPFDYTSCGKRLSIVIPRYNIGLLERGGCSQKPSNEQSTLRRNTNESTGAAEYGAGKPQDDNQSPPVGSRIKRKVRMPSEKRK